MKRKRRELFPSGNPCSVHKDSSKGKKKLHYCSSKGAKNCNNFLFSKALLSKKMFDTCLKFQLMLALQKIVKKCDEKAFRRTK
jgi:hypothetical protein